MRARRQGAWLCVALLAACGGCHFRSSGVAAQAAAAPTGASLGTSTVTVTTTDPAIALANLAAQTAWQERLVREQRATREDLQTLVSLYLMRGQFLGQLADYDRAEALATRLVREQPTWGFAWLTRAQVRSTFHQFTAALDDIARAERLGISTEATASSRSSIARAVGDYNRAEALSTPSARVRPTLRSLGALAGIAADRGDLVEAQRLYADARAHFDDVAPFPLAALELQEGLMLERAGRVAEARERFASAHARLPEYAPAASHLASALAATGDTTRATELLRELVARSDNPEYPGQLGALLAQAGRRDEAASLRAQAAARYQALLARHADAFADHAARFFIGFGAEPARALALAERNLALRPTGDAYQLVIDAALAAGQPRDACTVAARALDQRTAAPSLRIAAARAFYGCGQKPEGDRQIALASQS